MPGPYTDEERDAMLDALTEGLASLSTAFDGLASRVEFLEDRNAELTPEIITLQDTVTILQGGTSMLAGRVEEVEASAGSLEGDIARLGRRRQEQDPEAIDKPTYTPRPATHRVRRPDGTLANVVVNPR